MSDVIFQPIGRRITADPGDTLLEAAQAAGVALSAVCGGVGVCADCRVRVLRGAVSPLNAVEQDQLSEAECADGLRLACQTVIQSPGEIVVDVPPDSLSAPQRSQVEGEEIPLAVAPLIQVRDLTGVPPSIDDLRGDWERLQGLTPDEWNLTAPVMADLPGLLRGHNWRVRMITRKTDVVRFLPPNGIPLGFAVDVGTTGLAAYLVDLLSGETIGIAGATNPQIAYGEDVMARLTLVVHDPPGAGRLQAAIIGGLNDLLHEVCMQAGVTPTGVVDVVAVGNTAMHHLLLGLPVGQLGSAPYVPAISSPINTPARPLGLDVSPGAALYMPPNVAGFVGADHVSMLLATATPDQPGVTLSLDVGTNTEITLNAHGRLWSCSTASGPAFEGAHIRDGMRAADGAIERLIWRDGDLRWLTINHARPVGLCGSGILDAVAALRGANILTVTGAMRREAPGVLGKEDVNPYYEIVAAQLTGHGRAVSMSRSDVNEVQLAKAAIRAGIKLLVEQAGLTEADIDRVIVAGAFGNYIDLDSAITIGLFPPLPKERFIQVGNAAGIGAKRLLINAQERQRAAELVKHLEYIELTNHADFADRFSQALRLTPDPWD
jgi:uncharacterized 2Fe-2S/4Fe-4S cluster protein (DUF4445 family)